MVDNLNKAVAEREAHISALKNDIENLNIKFTEVEWQLQEKDWTWWSQIVAKYYFDFSPILLYNAFTRQPCTFPNKSASTRQSFDRQKR